MEFALHESRDSEFYNSKTMARLAIESTRGMRDVENNSRDYGIARDKARDKKNRPFYLETWSKT